MSNNKCLHLRGTTLVGVQGLICTGSHQRKALISDISKTKSVPIVPALRSVPGFHCFAGFQSLQPFKCSALFKPFHCFAQFLIVPEVTDFPNHTVQRGVLKIGTNQRRRCLGNQNLPLLTDLGYGHRFFLVEKKVYQDPQNVGKRDLFQHFRVNSTPGRTSAMQRFGKRKVQNGRRLKFLLLLLLCKSNSD
jgi:hypothetical protein